MSNNYLHGHIYVSWTSMHGTMSLQVFAVCSVGRPSVLSVCELIKTFHSVVRCPLLICLLTVVLTVYYCAVTI